MGTSRTKRHLRASTFALWAWCLMVPRRAIVKSSQTGLRTPEETCALIGEHRLEVPATESSLAIWCHALARRLRTWATLSAFRSRRLLPTCR